jgi:hypothetical protein
MLTENVKPGLQSSSFDPTVSLLEAIYERYAELTDLNGVHSYRMAYKTDSGLQRLPIVSSKEHEEQKLSQSYGGIKMTNVNNDKGLNNSYPPPPQVAASPRTKQNCTFHPYQTDIYKLICLMFK